MSANFALKPILYVLGWISVILGVIGAILPLIPTTPFLILAAFCFSKSSPRIHSWLTSIPHFGDAIIDWETNRVISPKAKAASVVMILCVFGSSITMTKIHIGLKVMLACIGAGCLFFILSRKSYPDE